MNEKNEILKTIISRRSVRSFSAKPVENADLQTLIEAACYAPSPLNNQPWRFFVLTNRKKIERIAEMVDRQTSVIQEQIPKIHKEDYLNYRRNATFFQGAGAVIIIALKPMIGNARGHMWGVPDYFSAEKEARGDIMSIGAASQNIMLAAESLGLGSCMMLYPLIANDQVAEMLDIRSPWKITAYIPVGHKTATAPSVPKRRDTSRIVEYI